jgi:hypothetical protein
MIVSSPEKRVIVSGSRREFESSNFRILFFCLNIQKRTWDIGLKMVNDNMFGRKETASGCEQDRQTSKVRRVIVLLNIVFGLKSLH